MKWSANTGAAPLAASALPLTATSAAATAKGRRMFTGSLQLISFTTPFWLRWIAIGNFALATAVAPTAERSESITVERLLIDAYIVADDGTPLENVTPSDLRVRVGGKPARVESVDAYEIDGEAAGTAAHDDRNLDFLQPRGRLFVYFFQTDFQRARVAGQMRMIDEAQKMVDELTEWDRVAVVSFDSHLKVLLDFTRDREAMRRAIRESILIADTPQHERSGRPSLVEWITQREARDAATPEEALVALGRALGNIEGAKSLVYFGWGLGRFGMGGVTMTRDWSRASALLEEARTAMFILDTSSSDYHSLEVGLKTAAEATGGIYLSTFRLPQQARARAQRTMSKRFEISVVIDDLPRGVHPVDIQLTGRRGRVLARSSYTLR